MTTTAYWDDDDNRTLRLCLLGCTPEEARQVLGDWNLLLAVDAAMGDAVAASFWETNRRLLDSDVSESVKDAWLLLHEWLACRYLTAINRRTLVDEVEAHLRSIVEP